MSVKYLSEPQIWCTQVSNYAKPGYECRHNCMYWNGAPYFAFGLGAASYINRQRFSRPRKMADYVKWVQQYAVSLLLSSSRSRRKPHSSVDIIVWNLLEVRHGEPQMYTSRR